LKPFIVPIFIPHGGCSHHCVFCNQRQITGKRFSFSSLQHIQHQINQFLNYNHQKRRPVQIAFFGGNFLGLKKDQILLLLQATSPFISTGAADTIRFSTRPDTINETTLALIRDYPVSTIELGVQSMADEVLALSKRGHHAIDTTRAVGMLRKEAYAVGLQMMVGLPGDTEKGVLASGLKIAALKPDFVRIYPTVVLKNSALAKWYQKGKYEPFTLARSVTLVKQLYLMFQKQDIPVVRMGLQASTDLDEGEAVLAGPYHPSFGHLVLSEIMLDRVIAKIKKHGPMGDKLIILVHPRCTSQVRGLNNQNIILLQRHFHLHTVKVAGHESLSPEQIQLVTSK
jgi:histone acetyltransferase (RNA polymerase elongator complex component)